MNRTIIGDDKPNFLGQVVAAFQTGDIDRDDSLIVYAAVSVAMIAGGIIGYLVMTAIHAHNAAALGVM